MHHQSQCGQWHTKVYQRCSEEGALTSQITNCLFSSQATSKKGTLRRETPQTKLALGFPCISADKISPEKPVQRSRE